MGSDLSLSSRQSSMVGEAYTYQSNSGTQPSAYGLATWFENVLAPQANGARTCSVPVELRQGDVVMWFQSRFDRFQPKISSLSSLSRKKMMGKKKLRISPIRLGGIEDCQCCLLLPSHSPSPPSTIQSNLPDRADRYTETAETRAILE